MPASRARPFRFGVEVAGARTAADWRATARAVEDMGYATLLVIDHLDDQLAPVPAMVAAADATTTLRVGTHVLANELRHPVLVAKEAATVDLLTDGRLELGLGAGWNASEHSRLGIDLSAPATRIERFAEALTIIKGVFENPSFSYSGRHYAVADIPGLPRPVQQPRPPIMVGGGGRRILSLAAREADIVSLNPNLTKGDSADGATMTAEATAAKVDWIRNESRHRPTRPEFGIRVYYTVLTDDPSGAAAALAGRTGLSVADAQASPHLLLGDADRLVDRILEYRDRFGISYLVITADACRSFAPVVSRLV